MKRLTSSLVGFVIGAAVVSMGVTLLVLLSFVAVTITGIFFYYLLRGLWA